ncbi:MAG: hypothetical protein R2855_05855 [Thermomicrobiales bacterium]
MITGDSLWRPQSLVQSASWRRHSNLFFKLVFRPMVRSPSLSDAIDGLPDAWWFRPRGFFLALVATAVGYVLLARGRRVQLLVNVGVAGGMVALLGLSLTTHAAARQRWDWLSTASVVVHEWSVGLWVGGLAALAIFWTSSRGVETIPWHLNLYAFFPAPHSLGSGRIGDWNR